MMPKQFGALALQLLQAASIPGSAIDAALAFREIAQRLATGAATIVESEKP